MTNETSNQGLSLVLPSQCGRECTKCIIWVCSEEIRAETVYHAARLPALMEKCRECPGWEEGKTVCWGSICPLRVCCQNCGLAASFQCRKHPCRQFLTLEPEQG